MGDYRELFFSSYIEGMRKAGWQGDERIPRIGFLESFALRSVWKVSKLLRKLQQDGESLQTIRLMRVAEAQMAAAHEAGELRSKLPG
jgi:hypothetical protein